MLLRLREDLAEVLFLLARDLRAKAHALAVHAVFDDLVQTVERAAANEENVRRIDVDELLLRVFASALRRDRGDRPFQDLQQRLLHTLAGNIARDRDVLAFAGYLVQLVDVDDAALGAFHIKIRRLQKAEKDVLHIFADIARLGERGGVGNGERHIQHARERLRKERFAAAGGSDEQNIGLLQLHIGLLVVINALIVVVNGDGKRDLRRLLPDDVFVEEFLDLCRLRKVVHGRRARRALSRIGALRQVLIHDVHAKTHAVAADVGAVAGDQLVHLILCPTAESAADLSIV